MTGVEQGAGAATKALEVVKELPLWLLVGLAISAGVLLLGSGALAAGRSSLGRYRRNNIRNLGSRASKRDVV
jgi:hypothetical protein